MKKIIILSLMAVFCAMTLRLSAADPADYLPAGSPAVVRINALRISNLPWLKKMLKSNKDSAKSQQEFEAFRKKYQLKEKDVFPGVAYIAGINSNFALYIQTGIPAKKLRNILTSESKSKSGELKISTTKIADRDILVITRLKKNKAEHRVGVLYLAEDVAMLFELKDGAEELIRQSTGKCALIKTIDQQAVISASMQNPQQNSQVASIIAKLDLNGPEQSDVELFAEITCDKNETAQQYAMQVQMMVPMFAGMIFGKNQALVNAVIKDFAVVLKEKQFTVKYKLNAATIETASKYLNDPANRPKFPNERKGRKQKSSAAGRPAATSSNQ